MKKEEITQDAIHSYQTYFHDQEKKTQHDYEGKDVVLDREQLTEKVNSQKASETKRHESLEVLRERLTEEAESSYKITFGETKQVEQVHKMNTQEVYEELNSKKNKMSKMANDLKEKQLNKMKH